MKIIKYLLLIVSICGSLTAADIPGTEQKLFVTCETMPTKLYKNEVFEIKLKATVAAEELGALKTIVANQSGLKLLNSNYKWKLDDDGSFSLSLFFKTLDNSVRLPDIQTSYATNGVDKESATINGTNIEALNVGGSTNYCGVIASSLSVSNYKIDGYDASNNILAIDISAKNANIEDFKLPNIAIQGVNSIKNEFASTKMFYHLIIPDKQQSLEFEYFDKEKGVMQTIKVALDLSKIEDKVSTQTDLQPKSADKALYVFLTVTVLASILYGIYYFKREKIFLILIVVTIVAGVIFLFIPNQQVKIKKDTIVYLLPTENSTAFFQANEDMPVEKLKESEGYTKIKLKDGKIGWVKGESVVGN